MAMTDPQRRAFGTSIPDWVHYFPLFPVFDDVIESAPAPQESRDEQTPPENGFGGELRACG